jgi:hypothetical protein
MPATKNSAVAMGILGVQGLQKDCLVMGRQQRLLERDCGPKESAMASAVAGSQACDGNQALHRPRLHSINKDTSGDGEQACPAED